MKAATTNGKKPKRPKRVAKKTKGGKETATSAANEATLLAWKHIYAKRDQFGKIA
jgi:hypothetical protein